MITTPSSTRQLVTDFIETIWNQRRFDRLDQFIHPAFTDHSLAPPLPRDIHGLEQWIRLTGQSFEHHTLIEDQVSEPTKSILKIKLLLKHIGEWRGIPPTGLEVQAAGYRCFRLEDGRIIGHWALVDGNGIEKQLKDHHR